MIIIAGWVLFKLSAPWWLWIIYGLAIAYRIMRVSGERN